MSERLPSYYSNTDKSLVGAMKDREDAVDLKGDLESQRKEVSDIIIELKDDLDFLIEQAESNREYLDFLEEDFSGDDPIDFDYKGEIEKTNSILKKISEDRVKYENDLAVLKSRAEGLADTEKEVKSLCDGFDLLIERIKKDEQRMLNLLQTISNKNQQ